MGALEVELRTDVRPMVLYCAEADIQVSCDFLAGFKLGNLCKNNALRLSKLVSRAILPGRKEITDHRFSAA